MSNAASILTRPSIYTGLLDDATLHQLPEPLPPHDDPDTPLVSLVDVHKAFGPLHVHRGVNLDVFRGQTTVLLGPSGTGKSVLIKEVIGLLQPDRGEVHFNGHRIDTMPEAQRVEQRLHMGFLFQMSALFDSMTIGENVGFPLDQHTHLDPDQRSRCVERVLAMVGLPGIQAKMPAEVSGGQRKRVALARAIVLQPALMLYDEPTTGLDPVSADVINELMAALPRNLGITSIVVTHDLASARKIADRWVLLYDGTVIADGSPDSFDRSEDPTVTRFIRGVADQQDIERIHDAFGALQASPPAAPDPAQAQP
ncbi:MAG: ATP-binding cassette domain-containing protein [Planctomycetota bacterium]